MDVDREASFYKRRIVRRNPQSVEKRILDAAQSEFMRVGYGRASTNMMARSFGLSKATIFRYFPSKRHLFEAVVARIASRWRDHLSSTAPGVPSPEDWLRTFAAATLSWLLEDEALFVGRMAISEGKTHPEIQKIWSYHATMPILSVLATRFAAWQASGQIRPGNPDDLAGAFLDMAVTGHVSRALYGDDLEREQLVPGGAVEHAVTIFLHGSAAS